MAEAGWYNDPDDAARARWFDGATFTEHTVVMADHATIPPPPSPAPGFEPAVFSAAPTPPAPTLAARPPAPPPPASPPPTVVVQIAKSNGMAVAALVLGIIGTCFGLIPLFFAIALPCGVLAVIFGFVGRRRGKQIGQRKAMATWGLALGLTSFALGIAGVVIVNDAVSGVSHCFDAVNNDINSGGNSSDAACN